MFLPNLECIEVMNGFKDSQRFQRELLETVRDRSDSRKVQRIKRVVIPRKLVDILHQYELTRLVPSFVLKESVSFPFLSHYDDANNVLVLYVVPQHPIKHHLHTPALMGTMTDGDVPSLCINNLAGKIVYVCMIWHRELLGDVVYYLAPTICNLVS